MLVCDISISYRLNSLQKLIKLIRLEAARVASCWHLCALTYDYKVFISLLEVLGFLRNLTSSVEAVILIVINLVLVRSAAGRCGTFSSELRVGSPNEINET
jgi:hypothetical protein